MSRTMKFAASLVVAGLMLMTAQAKANELSEWGIARMTGDVWIVQSGVQRVALKPDAKVDNGTIIRTGRSGRVILERGRERMLVNPGTQIQIHSGTRGGRTSIVQQAGELLVDVEKRNVKHFSVQTPYLAAVVKGTRFSVTVDRNGARVDVERGTVEVSDHDTGEVASVTAGQGAATDTTFGHGLSFTGTGRQPVVRHRAPRMKSMPSYMQPAANAPNGNAFGVSRMESLPPGLARKTGVQSAAASANGQANGHGNGGGNGNGNGGGNGNGNGGGNGNGNGGGNGNGNGGGNGNGNGGGNGNGNGNS